ncbi:uncharacterized protein LOC129243061 [Anastrepha obliqua]|uniref:uncharacterized protein LOC129243061 n=1 Tax=Anastrepha obliqua TaxID=95512 RepID=UPI002409EE0C|nr:uncharacterized protein LOC129243061 [Anastrepha obliqua]
MSYTTPLNASNANTWAEQSINKPHYTPGKTLKKAFKLLRRVFKPSTSLGKKSITSQKVAEQRNSKQAEESTLNYSILTTSSTFSVEEYENDLNELAELQAAANRANAAE